MRVSQSLARSSFLDRVGGPFRIGCVMVVVAAIFEQVLAICAQKMQCKGVFLWERMESEHPEACSPSPGSILAD